MSGKVAGTHLWVRVLQVFVGEAHGTCGRRYSGRGERAERRRGVCGGHEVSARAVTESARERVGWEGRPSAPPTGVGAGAWAQDGGRGGAPRRLCFRVTALSQAAASSRRESDDLTRRGRCAQRLARTLAAQRLRSHAAGAQGGGTRRGGTRVGGASARAHAARHATHRGRRQEGHRTPRAGRPTLQAEGGDLPRRRGQASQALGWLNNKICTAQATARAYVAV